MASQRDRVRRGRGVGRIRNKMRGGWGVAMAHMDSSPRFLHSPLYLSHLVLSPILPPSLVLLPLTQSLSLSCSWHWPDMLQQQSSLAH